MNSWKVILATLVIFGAGVVTGGLLLNHARDQRVAAPPLSSPPSPSSPTESVSTDTAVPDEPAAPTSPQVLEPAASPIPGTVVTMAATPWSARMNDLLRRMDQQLGLQPEQRNRIEKIIVDSQERTRDLWQPILPQMNQEMQNVHVQIRAELNPNQRRKFEMLFRARPGRRPDEIPNQITRGRPALAPTQVQGAITNPSNNSNAFPAGRKP